MKKFLLLTVLSYVTAKQDFSFLKNDLTDQLQQMYKQEIKDNIKSAKQDLSDQIAQKQKDLIDSILNIPSKIDILEDMGLVSKQKADLFDLSDPDVVKTFQQIVQDNGYIFEEHKVTTEDGYILKMFRIPGKKSELQSHDGSVDSLEINKKVVFLQHGVFDSADCWIAHYSDRAPAFILSNQGYDVWLGNTRGNKYSNQHIDPTISQQQYWDYSFQEMGDYDIPAALDYIRLLTKQDKVAYIGHSQGTAQMFYGLATNQDYFADRVSIFIALAPVTTISGKESIFLEMFRSNVESLMKISKVLKIYDIFQPNQLTTGSSQLICGYIPDFCKLGSLIADENLDLNEGKRAGVFFSHFPSGTSIRSLEHFSQIKSSGRFQTFDFGPARNIQRYGTEKPYEIPIQDIKKVPVAMFVGSLDLLSSQQDGEKTLEKMKNDVVFYQVYKLGHLGFMIAKDMSYFTRDVLSVLENHHSAKSNNHQNLE
ncbi:ab-hydrolase associated lipase region family protein [Stylonychia lemnae]|uniref:Ab-hydrolase associated lipase region family protein n=1 Tax=Stylonychia lemnae TaxID=5949 RepID=A0A077ZX24_STYLE|nr:ab-hydrolase associated lipase region family protein [Stylonychia lemnae]|eukprot:CDW73802.1 ab-hydrolase associated lipase region family protein [Stylonychia lemnae]